VIILPLFQLTVPPLPHYVISGFTTVPKGFKHPSRKHIHVFDLLVVTEGCLYMGEEDRPFEVTAEHALLLRPDSYHYSTLGCQEETSYYWLHFQTTGSWLISDHSLPYQKEANDDIASSSKQFTTQTFTIQLPQFIKLLQPIKIYEILQQLRQLNHNNHQSSIRWKQQVLFQELLQQLSASIEMPGLSPSKACAEQAAIYLSQHYRETITAEALGDSLNFHPVYIARCMQKEFACSPSEYLLRIRIEQAKLLLLQTDLPIALIADEVGFHHAAYFTSCFAKCEGISPRKYRQHFSHG
jgi:YesN/AraC family two-component response regulator